MGVFDACLHISSASIVCAYLGLEDVLRREGCRKRLKRTLINLACFIPLIVVTTIFGVAFVIYAGCRKSIYPHWSKKKANKQAKALLLCWSEMARGLDWGPDDLKMCEILFESNPQAILGKLALVYCCSNLVNISSRPVFANSSRALSRPLHQYLPPIPWNFYQHHLGHNWDS